MTVSSDYNTGYTAAFRVGDRIDRHWRGEWEIAYASNDFSQLSLTKAFGALIRGVYTGASGSESAITGTANILYDFTPAAPFIRISVSASALHG